MSITSNFPAIAPSLNLSFALTKALDPRITFTRASTATYYGTETAKAEENLILQSQTFETTWTGLRRTVTANTEVAPDGTTTADSVTQNSGETVAGFLLQNVSVIAADYVFSAFAKPNGKNFLRLTEDIQTGSGVTTWFDVQNGTVGATGSGHTATITAVGNGYYRCSIKFTVNAARTDQVYLGLADTNNSITVTDSGGLYLWGCQLEQRSAATNYTPTTTQTITNYIPVVESQASGVARFDHNPTTFESLGLLIEESRTNLVTFSEEFDNAGWTKNNSSITANTIVSPDGTVDAEKLTVDSGLTAGQVFQSVALNASTTFTLSCYAKAGEFSFVNLATRGPENLDIGAFFNLTVGTVGTVSAGVTASMTPVGNGWYRCAVTRTTGTGAAASRQRIYATGTDAVFSTGDGFSGIFIWGAQLEAGAFATSFIPTVASQVTRAADAAVMTGANFSSWYNAAEGTFFSSVVLNQTPTQLNSQVVFTASDNTNSNRFIVSLGSGNSGNINALVTTSGVTQAQTINGGLSTAGAYQYANAYKVNDFASVANGGVAVTDTSGTIPVVDRLYLGVNSSGTTTSLTATIKKLAYYPIRVSNTNLQALTS